MSESRPHEVLITALDRTDEQPRDRDDAPAPWESSMQATCDCLSWRGTLDNLERRHAEDELGETLYREFPTHTHPALVVAHSLLERGVIGPDELEARMAAVRARMERR